MVQKCILCILLASSVLHSRGQHVDSICFHLYTDSIKKSTTAYVVYNYINVDGRMQGGRWLPLTDKDVVLSATAGRFEGNSLILPADFKGETVTIRAASKYDAHLWQEVTVAVKKSSSQEKLQTEQEILNEPRKKSKQKRNRGG